MRKFEITLKDLSKYKNTGERKVVIQAVNEGTAIAIATQQFKGYDLVGFLEVGIPTEDSIDGVPVTDELLEQIFDKSEELV